MSTQANKSTSEPSYAKPPAHKSDLPWWILDISKYLVPETSRLLSEYAHITEDQQAQHVHAIRDQLWAIRSYPCTGLGCFLIPFVRKSAAYPTILSKLKEGGLYLDIGCFCGTDMRQLVFDGAPSQRMTGIDIVSHWDVGFAMYNDRDSFKAQFIEADLLKHDEVHELDLIRGKVDVANVSAVLHQWDYDTQVLACHKIVQFSKPETIVFGYQIGAKQSQKVTLGPVNAFRHDEKSFQKMWEEVSESTGTEWRTEAVSRSFESIGWDENDMGWLGPNAVVLDFVVSRQS